MNTIKNVAKRIEGLRESLDLTQSDIAKSTGITLEQYQSYESGSVDIPVSYLLKLANTYEVELSALLFGGEPKMKSYYVTRSGCGEHVERREFYRYQSLSSGFLNTEMHPFLVTIEPAIEAEASVHHGQELHYVLEGRMEMEIDGKPIVLEPGDSIIFDALHPHRMRALDDRNTKILVVLLSR